MFNFINDIIKKIIFLNLKIYKLFFSSLLGVNCRYTPTCSEYFQDAVNSKGVFYGTYLGFKRLFKCNPWGGSGYDPVEKKNDKNNINLN